MNVGLTPSTDASSCVYGVETLTLGSMTVQMRESTASCPPGDPCLTWCRDADSLLYRLEHTDELCRSIFERQAETCFDCVQNEPESEFAAEAWREMIQGGLDYCDRREVGAGTIAGSVIGGTMGVVLVGIGVFWLRRRRRKRRTVKTKGGGGVVTDQVVGWGERKGEGVRG